MFLDLINLYKKNYQSNKTPLEDFNTECFANILRLYENVKDDYLKDFLNLPQDNYNIKTQLKKSLSNGDSCIIDLVFIGKNNICFVENKIESFEGIEQLKRYGDLLDYHYKSYNCNLHYCTKYSDPKNKNLELTPYKFKQYKWFEIAKFLKKYSSTNPIIREYLNFLSNYKMAQDNTFKIENLLTIENLLKTVEIAEFHLNNCKPEFIQMFGFTNYNSNENWRQLKYNNRFCHFFKGIIPSSSCKYSEILYSIEFNTLKLNCQVYVDVDHEILYTLTKIDLTGGEYKREIASHGTSIYLENDLGNFLNNSNSDILIKDWFIQSFNSFKTLMENNPQIGWKL